MYKLVALWISLLLVNITTYASTPQVVVTLKPVHALVNGIMEGVGTPHLLLSGRESPHNYSLRPSQVRQLHDATLVIWVSPTVEHFLPKTLTTFSDKTQTLCLIDTPGLHLLKVRQGKDWETHHHTHHHNNIVAIDPHIWLSPDNAKMIVETVAQRLSTIDPQFADRYTANVTKLVKRIEQFDQTLKQQLISIKDKPFLVFHDAYQYFEHHYGLKAMGAITLSPGVQPGAKHLHQLRARLIAQKIQCVFSEPQFTSSLVTTLIERTSTQHGTLDPLGIALPTGTDSYFTLLSNLAEGFEHCLDNRKR